MEESNGNGKLVVGLLIGVAVGGALGMLFAPNKGSVTRRKIMSRGEEMKESVEEKYHTIVEKAKRELESLS